MPSVAIRLRGALFSGLQGARWVGGGGVRVCCWECVGPGWLEGRAGGAVLPVLLLDGLAASKDCVIGLTVVVPFFQTSCVTRLRPSNVNSRMRSVAFVTLPAAS